MTELLAFFFENALLDPYANFVVFIYLLGRNTTAIIWENDLGGSMNLNVLCVCVLELMHNVCSCLLMTHEP